MGERLFVAFIVAVTIGCIWLLMGVKEVRDECEARTCSEGKQSMWLYEEGRCICAEILEVNR